jgi:hypothetical protein
LATKDQTRRAAHQLEEAFPGVAVAFPGVAVAFPGVAVEEAGVAVASLEQLVEHLGEVGVGAEEEVVVG